jgi:hypothetical protein
MEAIWEQSVRGLPDAPTKTDFLNQFVRVAVVIERRLGGAYLVHPFVPSSSDIAVGDVVDVPMYAGGPRVGYFSGRPQILSVVCRHTNADCLKSQEGSRRGTIGAVAPRD